MLAGWINAGDRELAGSTLGNLFMSIDLRLAWDCPPRHKQTELCCTALSLILCDETQFNDISNDETTNTLYLTHTRHPTTPHDVRRIWAAHPKRRLARCTHTVILSREHSRDPTPRMESRPSLAEAAALGPGTRQRAGAHDGRDATTRRYPVMRRRGGCGGGGERKGEGEGEGR